jgi:D-alanyl-D-alanine carboxypeptidase (penicillin-binding protein 5/6)
MLKTSILGRILAIATALLLGIPPASVYAGPTSRPNPAWQVSKAPLTGAWAAVLLDWTTGQVLYEKNAYARRDPASTTKVLTALVALEQKGENLQELVTVSRRAANTPGSTMYVKAGEVYSLHDLLHGLLLRSGNDAAVAIAEHIGGSTEGFIKLMNAKARAVGALNSNFVNPHGLTDSQHYTTAYDLAVITRAALNDTRLRSIVSLREKELTYEQLNRDVVLHNTNRLLREMPEADGVKTGTTAAAGGCLVASATRDEHKLIAVVLHDGNRWSDSARLLNWGFDNFKLLKLGRKGDTITAAPVVGGKSSTIPVALVGDVSVIVPRKDAQPPQLEVHLQEFTEAPIRRGQTLGRVTVNHGGSIHAEVLLAAAQDMPRRNLLDIIYQGLLPLLRAIGREGLF